MQKFIYGNRETYAILEVPRDKEDIRLPPNIDYLTFLGTPAEIFKGITQHLGVTKTAQIFRVVHNTMIRWMTDLSNPPLSEDQWLLAIGLHLDARQVKAKALERTG